jgi:foldase protein PrsA
VMITEVFNLATGPGEGSESFDQARMIATETDLSARPTKVCNKSPDVVYYPLFLFVKEIEMKHALTLVLIIAVLFVGCSQKSARTQLKEGTPAFALAKELSKTLPALDPAADKVLVSAKKFEITSGEVVQVIQENMGNRTAQLKQLDAAKLKQAFEQSAVQLGERKLLLAAAAVKTVVSPEEMDKAMQEQYTRAGDEKKFLEALTSNGISIDYVKDSVRTSLLIDKYLNGALASQTAVTEAEIQKAYQQDKTASVRHILLLTEGKTPQEKAEIRKKMEDILARARKGEDFAALAKQYSEDPGSKDNGGLYENFGRGQMVKPFEEAAFSVPVGQISDIVETKYGYHILLVVDRKKETRPLEEVRPELEAQMKQAKEGGAYRAFMAKLKQEAGFKTLPW